MGGREEAGSDLDILLLGPQSLPGKWATHPATWCLTFPRLLLEGMWRGTAGLALKQAFSLYMCELICVGMQAHVLTHTETRS